MSIMDVLFPASSLPDDPVPAGDNDNCLDAAAYGRFSKLSKNHSNRKSATQQLDAAIAYAPSMGLRVVETYVDEDESGVAMMNRPGLLRMIRDAKAGRFRAVILSDISRLGRNAAHIVPLIACLDELGIPLFVIGMGRLTAQMAMSMAVVAEQAIGYQKAATSMSKTAKAANGEAVTRPPFGYRHVPGGVERFVKEPKEVAIIHYAIERLMAGASIAETVYELNKRGMLGDKKAIWSHASLVGSPETPGICRNPLIAGYRVYGRTTSRTSTTTGKPVSTPVPRSKWTIVEVPDLAIVDKETFRRLQDRLAARSTDPGVRPRGPRSLLTGKMRCVRCGANMVAVSGYPNAYYVRCRIANRGGDCSSYKSLDRQVVENSLLSRLQKLVRSGSLDELAAAEYRRQRGAREELEVQELQNARQRLAENARLKDSLVDAVAQGRLLPAWGNDRMIDLDRRIKADGLELARRERDLEQLREHVLPIERVRHALTRIRQVLEEGGGQANLASQAADQVRSLFDTVEVTGEHDRYRVKVKGFLAFETQIPRRSVGRPSKSASQA